MFIEFLSLTDFRSYHQLDIAFEPGVTVFVGANGLGKTNIVEAVGYLATQSSHRAGSDAPLVRYDADRALVRGKLNRGGKNASVELEVNPGRANRARINRGNPVRARDALGLCRTVLFAPEDLALVKGDPGTRRRFLDDLIMALYPHQADVRSDYERVLKQRNALLKSARISGKFTAGHEATLDAWDLQMARAGAQLLRARLDLIALLGPRLSTEYRGLTDGSKEARAVYRSSLTSALGDDGRPEQSAEAGSTSPEQASPAPISQDPASCTVDELAELYVAAFAARRRQELDRGLSLVGPHRDDVELFLGPAPAKGYASHGETWSLALALRLASYRIFQLDDPSPAAAPILILDDVFAELDVHRRRRLVELVADTEQVLVTAAVSEDVPDELAGRQVRVISGGIDDGALDDSAATEASEPAETFGEERS